MVKLTPDLIQQSMQCTNPVKDRELDLRGYKIPVVENMGATLDQFDTIDFSDNDIRKLDGFPLLKRIKTLLLNNNRIVRISETLNASLPNLETLVLTGNQLTELSDIDPLAALPNLSSLSLLNNPIASKPHYRQYIAHKLPQLRVLDFCKIKLKERTAATELFKSKRGRDLQKEINRKAKTFVPGGALPDPKAQAGPTEEERWKIRDAISKAGSLDEVERLSRLLQAGIVPGRPKPTDLPPGVEMDAVEEEEDEDDMEAVHGMHVNGN